MKKCTRILSCFLIIACLASSFCIPTFAATGDFSDGNMGQMLPFAYPERQKTEDFVFIAKDSGTGLDVLRFYITVTGVWSQVENTADMTNATCFISGTQAEDCFKTVQIIGNQAKIHIYRFNGTKELTFTFTLYTNGNIRETITYSPYSVLEVREA